MSTASKGAKPASGKAGKKVPVKSPVARRTAAKKPPGATGQVLTELKSLAKELNKAA